jgi:RNA polymerase sigma-70 factor, ECF subfamily
MYSAMSTIDETTRNLVRLVKTGDRAAFEQLVRPELARLARLAAAIVGHDADAHDALQETLTIAWRQSPGLRDDGRFAGWLTRILVHECHHVFRRRARQQRVAEVNGGTRQPTSVTIGFEHSVAQRDALQRAFDRLTPHQRALLALHHLEQRSVADIGEALRLPAGTVKPQLFSARKALAEALSREDHDASD